MEETRARRLARIIVVGIVLVLPTVSLIPLGALYLWQNGYVLQWALGALGAFLVQLRRSPWRVQMTNGRPVYVHWNGLAVRLKYVIKAMIRSCNATSEGKLPRFSTRRTRMPNQISI